MDRTYGLGTIEARGGRFRLRVREAGRYKDLGTFDTLEEAESVRRGWAKLAAEGEVVTTGTSLREYGAQWLDRRELRGARNIVTDRNRWSLHVATADFADWPLQNIRTADVQAWADALSGRRAQDKRAARKLAPQTVRHCANLVRAALKAAVKAELITRTPAAGLELPAVSRDEGWTYLLPGEQDRLTSCAEIPLPDRLLISFGLGSGLRQGEIYALELRDLHVGEDPRVVVRFGKPGQPPKNKRIRVVPLFGLALTAAREWLEILPRFTKVNPFRLVFPTLRGCRRRDSKPPRGWKGYLAAAGLAEPHLRHDRRSVRFHDLRHSCASSLVAGWWGRTWRLEEVREVLGHTSVTVTERYAHLAPSVLASAAAATPGAATPGNLPMISPTIEAYSAQNAALPLRATVDSNHWPSAPEADALSS